MTMNPKVIDAVGGFLSMEEVVNGIFYIVSSLKLVRFYLLKNFMLKGIFHWFYILFSLFNFYTGFMSIICQKNQFAFFICCYSHIVFSFTYRIYSECSNQGLLKKCFLLCVCVWRGLGGGG